MIKICQHFRGKATFGTWWILCLSNLRLDQISSAFSRLVRGAIGFTKMVPFERVHSFVGINMLRSYLEYWFSIRSFEAVCLKGLPDLFGDYEKIDGSGNDLRRSGRSCTIAKTALSARKASKFPVFVGIFAPTALKFREILFGLFLEQKDYKCFLKKKLLDKVICRGTEIKKAVQSLNEFYFDLFVE